MKASKFSDAQKAFILKQGSDGVPPANIYRKAGISHATYFNWRKKYSGRLPTEMRRSKQLEDENGKLWKPVADLPLNRGMLLDVIPDETGCEFIDAYSAFAALDTTTRNSLLLDDEQL